MDGFASHAEQNRKRRSIQSAADDHAEEAA